MTVEPPRRAPVHELDARTVIDHFEIIAGFSPPDAATRDAG